MACSKRTGQPIDPNFNSLLKRSTRAAAEGRRSLAEAVRMLSSLPDLPASVS
jgi:hypothetical protein